MGDTTPSPGGRLKYFINFLKGGLKVGEFTLRVAGLRRATPQAMQVSLSTITL